MVSTAAIAAARRREQEAVERQEAALGIAPQLALAPQLAQNPSNPPDLNAAVANDAAASNTEANQPRIPSPPAADEGEDLQEDIPDLAMLNVDEDDDYERPPPAPLPPPLPAAAYAIQENWTMPRHETYEGALRHFMAFVHQCPPYPKDTMISRPQFIQLQPGHIHDYLAFKAFGKVDFNYDAGDRPTHYRASSMEVIKMSISFFHPLRNVPFCNGQGNPTKADIINKLIKFVAKCEVRKEGALSKAKRALTEYQDGLSGRKPARLFTTQERNFKLNKQKYYRRNVIWQCMKRQIARGLTPEQAAAELHTIYGAKTNPTAISKMLVADKRRYSHNGGYHPNLSVYFLS